MSDHQHHDVDVVVDFIVKGYRPSCSCGYVGQLHGTTEQARAEGEHHCRKASADDRKDELDDELSHMEDEADFRAEMDGPR